MGEHEEFTVPGLTCGKCGEILRTVGRTTKSTGFILRERLCQNCGNISTTSERVINTRPVKTKMNAPFV